MKRFHILSGIIFAAFVMALTAAFIFLPDKTYSSTEKRNLQTLPSLTVSSLTDGSFMTELEDYTADQFPLRNTWMKIRTGFYRFLGSVESQGVYYMKDGGLAERFNEPDAENMQDTMAAMAAFAERHPESRFSFLLSPTAIGVYPENIPAGAPTASEDDYIDSFYTFLAPTINCIDVRDRFHALKDDMQLFYRTDHHWTTEAAYEAYRLAGDSMGLSITTGFVSGTVANAFSGSLTAKSGFSVGTPDSITVYLPEDSTEAEPLYYTVTYTDTSTKTASCYDVSKLASDDAYQVFFGSNHPLIEIETVLDTDRSILVIKDSYANCFIPFLIPEYKRITVLDPRYYYEDIDALMVAGEYTEVLFLYNAATLSADTSLKTVLTNEQ